MSSMIPGRALVVAAHADDETLGTGGTLAKWSDSGSEIMVVQVTAAGPSVAGRNQTTRREDALRAIHILTGGAAVHLGDFHETNLHDSLPRIAEFLRKVVRIFQPQIVFTHHEGDLHQDHQVVSQATQIATRPYDCPFLDGVYMYGVDLFPPRERAGVVFVPLSDAHIDRKIRALKEYTTEVQSGARPRSPDVVLARARYCGAHIGQPWAEVFEPVWHLIR